MALPYTVIWDITGRCNLRCLHCFNHDRYVNSFYGTGIELNTHECKLVIDKFAESEVHHIHLLGGEPLLRKDIFEIIKYTRDKNIRVTINTNGILLNESCAKNLINLEVDQVVVSLDGATPDVNDNIRGEGVFGKVVKNLLQLNGLIEKNNSKMRTGIAFTMLKKNLHHVPLMLDLAKSLNVDMIDFMDIYLSGRAYERQEELKYLFENRCNALEQLALKVRKEKHFDILIQLDIPLSLVDYLNWRYSVNFFYHPRNMGCQAGEKIWFLQADGRILPCGMTNNPLYCKKIIQHGGYKLENINILNVPSLKEIDNSDFFITFREFKFFSKQKRREPCSFCKFREVCLCCPILHYELDNVPDCEEVLKRKRTFIEEVLRKKCALNRKLRWRRMKDNKIEIFDGRFHKYRKIEGCGVLIWDTILAKETIVKEIVDKISSYYVYLPSVNIVEEDVVKFIYELYLSNLVDLV